MRISIRITAKEDKNHSWTTATFLIDTGACAHMYLSQTLVRMMKKRTFMEDGGSDYVEVEAGGTLNKCIFKDELPSVHQPANVMGLPMLFLMGLRLKQGKTSTFHFDDEGVAYDIGEQDLTWI